MVWVLIYSLLWIPPVNNIAKVDGALWSYISDYPQLLEKVLNAYVLRFRRAQCVTQTAIDQSLQFHTV